MTRYALSFLSIVVAVTVLGSCSVVRFAKMYSDADDSGKRGRLNGNIYRTDDTSYRIGTLSEYWELVDSGKGDILFWNSEKNATITLDSVCDENKLKYNLKALSDSLVIGIKDKEMVKRDQIVLDGADALYTQYEGEYESNRVGIATIVLKKQKCIYDFSYSALVPNFNMFLKDYLEFASDFGVVDQQ